jgi:hypothetical protein
MPVNEEIEQQDLLDLDDEEMPVSEKELYGLSIALDEMRIANEELSARVDGMEKTFEMVSAEHQAFMKIAMDKAIVTNDELKKIYLDFKNSDYGVVH